MHYSIAVHYYHDYQQFFIPRTINLSFVCIEYPPYLIIFRYKKSFNQIINASATTEIILEIFNKFLFLRRKILIGDVPGFLMEHFSY